MKTLYTLAYPTISSNDLLYIEDFRRAHDPQCNAVQAHFTMVFGCAAIAEDVYTQHVQAVSRAVPPIEFVCRYAMLGTDHEAGRASVFLVPDEGYSGLSRLHDALYRGVLAEHLRLDFPYIPHITVGSTTDRIAARRLCDDLNRRGLEVRGSVTALMVAALEAHKIHNLVSVQLTA